MLDVIWITVKDENVAMLNMWDILIKKKEKDQAQHSILSLNVKGGIHVDSLYVFKAKKKKKSFTFSSFFFLFFCKQWIKYSTTNNIRRKISSFSLFILCFFFGVYARMEGKEHVRFNLILWMII